MKIMSKLAVLVFAACLFSASPASAGDQSGFYAGMEISTSTEILALCVAVDIIESTLGGVEAESCDDASSSRGGIFGYSLNRFMAIETSLRFADGYHASFLIEGEEGEEPEDDQLNADFTSFSLGVQGRIPLITRSGVTLVGRAGFHRWELEGGSGVDRSSVNIDDFDLYYSVGVEYRVVSFLDLRTEVTRYEYGDDEAEVFSAAVIFRF